MDRIVSFLREHCYEELKKTVEGEPIEIDFRTLELELPDIAEKLLEEPEEVISLFKEALKEIDIPEIEEAPIHFKNIPDSAKIRIRNLRSKHLNRLICVEGIVKVASEVKPRVYKAIFLCPDCNELIEVDQAGSTIRAPGICPKCGRRSGFILQEKKMFDSRWIILGEPFEIASGEKPGEVKTFLKEELTTPLMQRRTDPGNRIIVVGILKELPRKIHGKEATQSDFYVEANHIEPTEETFEELKITKDEEVLIEDLAKDKNLFKKLVASLAPSIYGYHEIKEGLLLQLFGGTPFEMPDGTKIRDLIHILLVGDPSTGKSQLLKLISNLALKSKYVSGKGVTGAGLVSTVRKDEFTGGWVLEAGALVLCNHGLLAIDEFDKVSKEDMIALHEAMEQGSISIAKASIIATLPAHTSILAGANPKLGRFDLYRPIADQIAVPPTILSRFDLKFVMKDIPNLERDEAMVDHVFRARTDKEYAQPEIPVPLLRKYIAYAKQNIEHIEISDAAWKMFKDFFLKQRSAYSEEDSTVPITFRQFEALIRLAQASAKIRLKDKATQEDAERAIKIMKYSLMQLGFDPESKKIDIDRAESAIAASQRSKIRILLDIIDELEKEIGKEVPVDEIIRRAEEEGLREAENLLFRLKKEGIIYEPKAGFIKKV